MRSLPPVPTTLNVAFVHSDFVGSTVPTCLPFQNTLIVSEPALLSGRFM